MNTLQTENHENGLVLQNQKTNSYQYFIPEIPVSGLIDTIDRASKLSLSTYESIHPLTTKINEIVIKAQDTFESNYQPIKDASKALSAQIKPIIGSLEASPLLSAKFDTQNPIFQDYSSSFTTLLDNTKNTFDSHILYEPTLDTLSSITDSYNITPLTSIKPFDTEVPSFSFERFTNPLFNNSPSIKSTQNEYHNIGIFSNTDEDIRFRLDQSEDKIYKLETKIELLSMKVYSQDGMIQELLEHREKKSLLASPKTIKYNPKNGELQIGNTIIPIRTNTNQAELCALIFKSEHTMRKTWDSFDLIDELGYSESKNWNDYIYSTARHLNEKIQKETGIQHFFIFTTKTITINPKYVS